MEQYEEWNGSIPPLPSRSRLYHLEPIGIGTPYVESLTGYIARLAETHCVTPKDLIMQEIIPSQSQTGPILNYYYRLNQFWINNAMTLNGISPIARLWVERLQSFTSCENLRFLTLLTWSEVIGLNKLLRRRKAWCPVCYEEWRQTHQVVYEPLLWALASVSICFKHRQLLITSCPQCQRSSPLLTQIMRLGYCSQCMLWLGNALSPQVLGTTSNDREELKHRYWVTEVVGELLASAPNLSAPPSKDQIAAMMILCLEYYAKGNMRALARLVKLNAQALWEYIRGTEVPNFDSLLRLCSALSITPLEFLATKTLPDQRIPQFVVDNLPVVSPRKRKPLSDDDVKRMRQVLEAVIAEERDPPSNLLEVANSIGYDVSTIRRHCPDLSKKISARSYRQWIEDDYHRMKQELENALKSDERVSLSAVAQRFGCDSGVLHRRFPALCRAVVTRYRERFDYEQIHRRLKEVLANNQETPSVKKLARQMGYGSHIFWIKFPDLCNQVTERRSTARRKHHNERIATHCNEIRKATALLHNQGVYPSSWRVAKQLSNPHFIRTREGHEAWRVGLEELAYPTDHLKKYI